MYIKSIIGVMLLCSRWIVINGQDLLSIKPEVFIEGEPGNVTCTNNNQKTTFFIYNNSSGQQVITACYLQSPIPCVINFELTGYRQYYSLSKTTNSVTIHINTVNRTRDGGQWRCKAIVTTPIQDSITIDVKVPVSSVEITNNNKSLIKDRAVNLECKTTGGYPLPNITWSIGTRILMTSVSTTTSILPYQPVVSDQGQRLQCSATNGFVQSQTDSFQLNITYKPVVDIKPSITSYKLIQNQTVQLECQVTQSNPVVTSYKWYRNGNITPGSSLYYSVISNDGSYSCSATNSVGESNRSRVISVEILYPPTVATPPSPYSIIESTTLTLPCIATSNPVPNNYTWSGPNNLKQSQQNLTISSINRDQTGQYTCTVSNTMTSSKGVQQTGIGFSSTTLNVLYGPEVSVSKKETNIKEKENLRINCTVKSNPPTNDIVWYQSNGDIVPNQPMVNSGANRRDLVINDINRSKSDNYTCTARLDLHPTAGGVLHQTHSQSSIINVQYFDDIIIATNQTKVKENDAVFITCTVDSNPPASIKWFKDGDVELPTSNSNIYLISSISCLDAGNYSCLATNPVYTNQKTKSSEQLVHCSPRLDTREDNKLKVSGNIGDTVELTADIISYPGANFQWFYKDNGSDIMIGNKQPYLVINNQRFINSYRSMIRINITSIDIYRQYYLNITNDDGLSNSLQFRLISITVPDRPQDVKLLSKTLDTICIEWTPGFNGGASQSFIVQHSTDDKTWANSSTIPDSTNNGRVDYCIEGLEPDTSYYIRVIASNKYGDSLIGTLSQSEPPKTAPRKATDNNNNNTALIGGVVGAVLALIIIIIFVVLIIRRKKSKSPGKIKESDSQLVLNETPSSNQMIIDENPAYVSVDDLQNNKQAVNNNACEKIVSPSFAAVKKTNKSKPGVETAPVYSSVNKNKQKETKKEDKTKSKAKKQIKGTGAESQNPQTKKRGEVYENVGIFGNKVYENGSNETSSEPVKHKNDDLVYVDLKFDKKPSNKVIKKPAEEDKVEYGSIDYGKRGPTPPPASDSSDDEMDYLPPRKDETS